MTNKQGEQKDILEKDEIPPDTQINSEHHENIENEDNENNQNRIINQNQSNEEQMQGEEEDQIQVGEDMQKEEQMQGGEEENNQEAEDQEQAEEEDQIQEEGDEVQDNDEQVEEGGEEVQDNNEQVQEGEEEVQDNYEQIQEVEQADVGQQPNLEGTQYQVLQNGQLYQVDQNDQIYRINQRMYEEEMKQLQQLQNQERLKGEQVYQYQNMIRERGQIVQPIQQNQTIQGMQEYQQNQIMQGYEPNQIMQGYEQNQIMQGYPQSQIMQGMQGYQQNQRTQYYQNQSFEPNQENAYSNENDANYPSKRKKKIEQESKQKKRESKGIRKEPKDSNPKIHLRANKVEHKNILRNLSNTKIYNNSSQKFSFVINSNDKQTLKPSQSILFKNLNEINKIELKEKIADFVEIPRKDYDNYEGKEIIIINDGMDTGEYKFIGEQTTLQEKYPKEKGKITQEEINQEIGRRKKIRKQKKVTYEIIDKFYTVTDVRTKTIKKIDNNTSKKNEFYSTLETNIKNANISDNKKNDNLKMKNNFENNCQGVGSAKNYQSGDNIEGNYNLNKGNAKSVYYQSGGNAEENYYQSRGNSKGIYYQGGANEAQFYQSGGNAKGFYYQSGGKNEGNYYQSGGGSSRGIFSYGSGKGGYYHNSENIISDYYQNKGSNYKNDNNGNYSEFRKEVPMFRNNSNFNYINSILSIPTDNYSKYLLEQINKIRTDPQSFIGVIEDAKANIKKDRYGRLIYDGKMKIALGQGEAAFNDAIKFLKKLDPMDALEYSSLLTVVPPQNQEEIKDKEDLNKKIEEMIKDGTDIKSYWRDVIKDPEISFLLMIVDDNGTKSGKRRRDILDPYMKYIGISSAEINKNFVCYITLSS